MKILPLVLIAGLFMFGDYKYEGSTTASVTLAGSIIKTKNIDPTTKKYKRKDCPVCKGTGKYLSGDNIKMVDCGYCEPEKKNSSNVVNQPETIIYHPPIMLHNGPKCTGPNCRLPNQRYR